MTIQEYRGITNPALIGQMLSSGDMLFGMQLNEILWVLVDMAVEIGLYGCITTPLNNQPIYYARKKVSVEGVSMWSASTEIALAEPAVEETSYNVIDFYVTNIKEVFKGIKVKSLSEAEQLPSFYMIDEKMMNDLVIQSFRTLNTEIWSNEKIKSARPKERTGAAVNFNQKKNREAAKDRMILI
jgi:hypothetical protein